MPPQVVSRDVIVDVTDYKKSGLIKNFSSNQVQKIFDTVSSDGEAINFFPVRPTGDSAQPWETMDLTGYGILMALGNPLLRPLGGTWKGIYQATSSAAVALSVSGADLQTALNAVGTITAAGGITVEKASPGNYYVVQFNLNGARDLISGDSSGLTPSGSIIVEHLQIGDVNTKARQGIRIRRPLLAYTNQFAAVDPLEPVVEVVAAGSVGTHAIQKFSFSRSSAQGSFSIAFDGQNIGPLPYNATVQQVQDLLEEDDYLVTGVNGQSWSIEKLENGAVAEGTMNVSGLTSLFGYSTILNLLSEEMFIQFGDSIASDLTQLLEIELTPPGGLPFTCLRASVKILREVITNSSPVPAAAYQPPYVQNLFGITGLAGGTILDLDSITSTAMIAGQHRVILFLTTNNGGMAVVTYRIKASTDATSLPWKLRPVDYAGGTNEKVWFLESIVIDACPAVWDTDANGFHRLLAGTVGGVVTLNPEVTLHTLP